MDLSNTLLITHKDCLDGAGCALTFISYGGRPDNIKYVLPDKSSAELRKILDGKDYFFLDSLPHYDNSTVQIKAVSSILVADVGVDESTAKWLEDNGLTDRITIVDHHKTNGHLDGRKWCRFNVGACATYLLEDYLYFHCTKAGPNQVRGVSSISFELASVINDYDMWLLQDPRSTELAILMQIYGQQAFVECMLQRIQRAHSAIDGVTKLADLIATHLFTSNWTEQKLLIARKEAMEAETAEAISRMVLVNRDDKQWGYVSVGRYATNITLDRMLREYGCDIAVNINLQSGAVAMRSLKDQMAVDCSAMAAKYGGGGHASAAGHPFDKAAALTLLLEHLHG